MMALERFFDTLAEADKAASAARTEVALSWPDGPPPTLLASRMGKAVAADLLSMLAERLRVVLEAAEEVLRSDDELAKDVVATGFLEALVSECVRSGVGTEVLRSLMGPRATSYVQAWEEFEPGA
jgi:hypothetical protein